MITRQNPAALLSRAAGLAYSSRDAAVLLPFLGRYRGRGCLLGARICCALLLDGCLLLLLALLRLRRLVTHGVLPFGGVCQFQSPSQWKRPRASGPLWASWRFDRHAPATDHPQLSTPPQLVINRWTDGEDSWAARRACMFSADNAYQMCTRSCGARNSFSAGCGENAVYQVLMFLTVRARKAPGA